MIQPAKKPIFIGLLSFLFLICSPTYAQSPTITGLSPTSGPVGTVVTLTGTNFGVTQSGSTISLNGTTASVVSWSNTSILATVPSGASSGAFSVTVNGSPASSGAFTVTPLPMNWSDGDVGSVGVAGSATYAGGVFTVNGAGAGVSSSADAVNFAYQALSGDGTIVARVVNTQGYYTEAGVTIRETLDADATAAYTVFQGQDTSFYDRTSTGGSIQQPADQYAGLPYWVMVVRSGSTFSSYMAPDGVNWTQLGTSQTITMAQNVYIGLVVSSQIPSSAAAATFDNVSISSTASPAPAITNVSPAAGTIGSQAVISGSNFGASQGGSTVGLNGAPVIVSSWSGTSITITIPSGATSGPLVVSVAPSMNASNPFIFLIGTQLLNSWTDVDIGAVGLAGSATYGSGTFTVNGAGQGISGVADGVNFLYQSLSGDGTIIARVVSVQGSGAQAGVMIRETLDPGATFGCTCYSNPIYFYYRTTTNSNTSYGNAGIPSLPYWVELVRSGSTFSSYISPDGVNWTPTVSSQTITMAQNVYVGLAVSSQNTSSLATATFDNVSINSTVSPAPVITGLSATTGSVGSQVLISGSGFGPSQGNSVATVNSLPLTINSWSDVAIIATIPSGATSGPLMVSVAPSMNDSNYMMFTVTTQPLPNMWLDQDIGVTGLAGSASYAGNVFTVNGAGYGVIVTADGLHFVYQSLSGDGTIVARVASVQGSGVQAGVMIRETLDPAAVGAYVFYNSSTMNFYDRTSAGGGWGGDGNISIPGLPYWVKLVRAGNTFTAYTSQDGLYWTQLESSQTITMAQNVYVGLAVTSQSTSSLATGTFDNVSIDSTASPAPVITSLSATTGSVGSQVIISGSGFGASIGTSTVFLNDAPVTIDSWSDSSIIVTIPSGATSGLMVVSVAPAMNDSDGIGFTVTSQALPTAWLDQDIGDVAMAGSASFSSGTFTGQGSGTGMGGTADALHFVYQPLSGDGFIVARVVSLQNGYLPEAGVMIRETLDPASANAYVFYSNGAMSFSYRASAGASTGSTGDTVIGLAYWVKLVRAGNSFSAYISPDGVTWTQQGATQTISMAQNTYIGMAVANQSNSILSLATATFDNVSVTIGTSPFVTGVSPVLGGIGSSVTISGSNFGATQGTSTVTFNGATASSVTSWSNSQIVAAVPSGATSGPVNVTVNSVTGVSSASFTVIYPVITSVSPPAAPVGGSITITGTGFGPSVGTGLASFNGITSPGSPWSNTSVTTFVPAGATTGYVSLIEDGVSSNSLPFTVIEGLSVTSVFPTSGQIGSTVIITGTGFGSSQSDSTVTFNGTAANIVSWSDTSIVATVPAGASTGPVIVEVAGIIVDGPTFEISSSVTLSDSLGNQSTYTAVMVGGKWYVSSAQGSGCSTCTVRGNTTNQFDSYGNVLATTDALGHITSYTYDSNNNLASVTQPSVGGGTPTTSYTYNTFGEVLTMTDPLGNVTTNAYDSHGNLTSVTSPAPGGGASSSVTQFAYNSLGELTQITDPLGRATTMTYTSVGLIASITDPQNNVTSYTYDAHGNRTSITDPLSHVTGFAYDSGDRLKTITYPGGSTTTFGYDYRGRRTSMTDQDGKTTTYAYDDADRLTSVTDAATHVTGYGYDTESNLTSVADANSHTTDFNYDAFGRVTETIFPSNHYETYAYDADNNLTSKTDRNGQTIQYVYDALNRLTQKNYPNSTSAEYTYDLIGKILQVSDPTGTYSFAYDNMGRLIGTGTQYSFLSGTFTNSYSYDANSNRTGFTAPDSSTNTYSYDTLNRLNNLTSSWAGSFGFSYDALSRRTQMTRPNGISTSYSYDNLSHLLSVLHQLSGSTIDGASYTVDSAGNRTAKTNQLANVTTNYGYDSVYELLQATQGGTTTESYTYDPVGNRLSSLGVSSYTNNSSNELTATSSASYTYDYNGNMTSKTVSGGTTDYSWDYENRLTGVTLPNSGGTVTFKYDPMGRRIEKTTSSATSIYAYDGDNLIEETNSSGAVVARYTQTQDIDEPLAMLRSSTTNYYQADGLGSVTSLSSTAGALAQAYTYDSFGNQTASSGSLTNSFRYAGREFDTETNLYYNRARYLDQSTGRFLSEDPVRYLGGLNFYAYAQNNTPDLADPRGLSPGCTLIGSTQIASWTTAARRYTTPWTFAFATTGEGGPDRDSGALLMILNCNWRRNYVREEWQTKLYLNTYLCTDNLPCGVAFSWFEFSLDTKKNYLGEEPGGTETTTTSRQVLGYESEFLDQAYCNKSGMVPPN